MKIDIPGYIIDNKLHYQSDHTIILRGIREVDQAPVIFKTLKDQYASPLEIAQSKQEYEIIKLFDTPYIIKAYGIEKFQNRYVIILEKAKGDLLADIFFKKKKLNLSEFLTLAINITEAVGKIHQQNIVHNDINPYNIICDVDNKEIKIIDFNLATSLPKSWAPICNPNVIQGTLAYLSPEQTGRMNRGIDFRTDFYSLGVTFYQMLTGQLPFPSNDPVEIIYGHVAIIPKAPNEIDPSIPEAISSIIMKLLAKNAEDRYQNPNGLLKDLRNCQSQLKTTQTIHSFVLGTQDFFTHFQIPEKLYGRTQEIQILLNTYEYVIQGKIKLLLVTGEAGIGKTTLVHEIYKPIVEKHGYFISGKFDQFYNAIPYTALTQAFNELVNLILAESEERIAIFKKKVLEAVKDNLQIIIGVIPNLALIFEEYSSASKLDSPESQNRFKNVFQDFITVLATEEHPLTVYLDNLQWADLNSLKLLEIMMTSDSCRYLLIIGAYRSNEVDSIHPLTTTIENLKRRNVDYGSIYLGPLALSDIEELLEDTLRKNKDQVSQLAKICYDKTKGNPFFLKQILQTLYNEQIIEFDQKVNEWTWDLNKIQEKKITDNVVDLLIDKIDQLSEVGRRIIKSAACIGNVFNTGILGRICGMKFEEVFVALIEIMEGGFALRLGGDNEVPSYQFAHDRIQQAAYLLIPEKERPILHYHIGQLILQDSDEKNFGNELFTIVNQLNYGVNLIESEGEKLHLINLNLLAGKKAKDSAAYQAAVDYFKIGVNLLPEDHWVKTYDLSLPLYVNLAVCLSLIGLDEQSKLTLDIALEHVQTSDEKAKIYFNKGTLYLRLANFREALTCFQQGLKLYGINVQLEPTKPSLFLEKAKLRANLVFKGFDSLKMPKSKDERISMIFYLYYLIVHISFMAGFPSLLAQTAMAMINMTFTHGIFEQSSFAFISLAMFSGSELRQRYPLSYKWGCKAVELANLFPNAEVSVNTQVYFYCWISRWGIPIRENVVHLKNLINQCRILGSPYIFPALAHMAIFAFMRGESLESSEKDIKQALGEKLEQKNSLVFALISHTLALCQNLRDSSQQKDYNFIAQAERFFNNPLIYLVLSSFNIYQLYTEQKYDEILVICEKLKPFRHLFPSHISWMYCYFYQALVLTALGIQDPKKGWESIEQFQQRIRRWAEACPENYLQYYLILSAEIARLQNKRIQAIELYENSIKAAQKNGFLQDEALANELLGKFYLSLGKEQIAKVYLEEALHCYLLWGSGKLVSQLEQNYGILLETRKQSSILGSLRSTSVTSVVSGKGASEKLDMLTLQKCSQTISSSIVLTDLLKKLMYILIENAGARKSFLLLNKKGKFLIEAEGNVDKEETIVLQSIEITDEILPSSIIRYVIHSKESVVLDHAAVSGLFITDPYIVKNKSKSILCVPLLNKNILTGVLYLENNLLEGAFTEDRIDLLRLLSSQISISIDNANLYEGTLRLNESYERFVPRDFLNLLGKESIIDVLLGDHTEKKMSILFTDIRNFTALSERMTPDENFAFINNILNVIAPIIRKHHGFIDKYIGDAIMALYPKSADDAVQCALEMQRALKEYNLTHKMIEPIRIGIGINTGLLMLGTVGEKQRLGATVISDAVNISSRVESLTKEYEVDILITGETYQSLVNPEAYHVEKLVSTTLKGKLKTITVYKVSEVIPHTPAPKW